MLFVDDIVLVDEIKEIANAKLEFWRKILDSKGFKLSRIKIECVEVKFSNRKSGSGISVKVEE